MNFHRKCLVFGYRNLLRIQKVRITIVVVAGVEVMVRMVLLKQIKITSISANFAVKMPIAVVQCDYFNTKTPSGHEGHYKYRYL